MRASIKLWLKVLLSRTERKPDLVSILLAALSFAVGILNIVASYLQLSEMASLAIKGITIGTGVSTGLKAAQLSLLAKRMKGLLNLTGPAIAALTAKKMQDQSQTESEKGDITKMDENKEKGGIFHRLGQFIVANPGVLSITGVNTAISGGAGYLVYWLNEILSWGLADWLLGLIMGAVIIIPLIINWIGVKSPGLESYEEAKARRQKKRDMKALEATHLQAAKILKAQDAQLNKLRAEAVARKKKLDKEKAKQEAEEEKQAMLDKIMAEMSKASQAKQEPKQELNASPVVAAPAVEQVKAVDATQGINRSSINH